MPVSSSYVSLDDIYSGGARRKKKNRRVLAVKVCIRHRVNDVQVNNVKYQVKVAVTNLTAGVGPLPECILVTVK